MKNFKYLFSFLLIFGLTVSDSTVYSQSNTTNYHQVSYFNSRSVLSYKQDETYAFAPQIILVKPISIVQFIFEKLQEFCHSQINQTLFIQTKIFHKIHSLKNQQKFLSERITPKTSYPNLYIA